jgi:hypothetical protein
MAAGSLLRGKTSGAWRWPLSRSSHRGRVWSHRNNSTSLECYGTGFNLYPVRISTGTQDVITGTFLCFSHSVQVTRLVAALGYEVEGCGFDSRWRLCTLALGSNRPLTGVGGKGCRCIGLITLPLSCADYKKSWLPQPPGVLGAYPGLYRDGFTLLHNKELVEITDPAAPVTLCISLNPPWTDICAYFIL